MKKFGWEGLINVSFWILTAWLITSSFSIQSQEIEVVNGVEQIFIRRDSHLIRFLLVQIVICCIAFYLNFFLVKKLKNGLDLRQVGTRSLFILLMTWILVNAIGWSGLVLPHGLVPGGIATGVVLFYYAISNAYGIGKLWLQTELQRQHLSLEKKEAELHLLRSRLQPHFLFNVLNNLLSMVDQQSNPQLAESISRLSDLLRYVVYDTDQPKVMIAKEILFIRNFAALQLLRFEKDEVRFSLEVEGSHVNQLIEPGIFVPFVENAFKYGTAPETQSSITIRVDVKKDDEVIFKIENPILSEPHQQDVGGSGLQATRERLQIAYPNRHTLNINQTDGFSVTLILQNDKNDHS